MRNTASMGFSVKLHVLVSLTLFTNKVQYFTLKLMEFKGILKINTNYDVYMFKRVSHPNQYFH